jgi:hypothetical protein
MMLTVLGGKGETACDQAAASNPLFIVTVTALETNDAVNDGAQACVAVRGQLRSKKPVNHAEMVAQRPIILRGGPARSRGTANGVLR